MSGIVLRQATSGEILEGSALLPFLKWNPVTKLWEPGAGGADAAALANTLWVQAAGGVATGPGLPFKAGTDAGAFSTMTAAAAALAAGDARLLVAQGDYSAEAAIDFGLGRKVSLAGIGGGWTVNDDLTGINDPPKLGPITADILSLDNLWLAGQVNPTSMLSARGCLINAPLASLNANFYLEGCHVFDTIVTVNKQVQLVNCSFTTFGGPLNIQAAEVVADDATIALMGANGVTLTGVNNVQVNRHAGGQVAWLHDADEGLNSPEWGYSRAVLPGNTLTAAHALTVDMTNAPADVVLFVDRYDTTANAYTVNGTSCPAASVAQQGAGSFHTRYIFQNVGGVLTLVQVQLL